MSGEKLSKIALVMSIIGEAEPNFYDVEKELI
jgi:hypothetical protein